MDRITRLAAAGAASSVAAAAGLYVDDVFSTYLYEGIEDAQKITNGIRLADGVDILPGTALGGGYFAGFISQTANGNATHALIVAPAASGYNGQSTLQWKTSSTSTSGTSSLYDGAANTANMADANHPAANYCAGLSIGGYSDWYLPARYELGIAYYNLKPTTTNNSTGFGANSYAVPQRGLNHTAGNPAQTSVAAFQSGGAEAFVDTFHWSSTEASATDAWELSFSDGGHGLTGKAFGIYVRAFRKIAINDSLLDSYRLTGEGGMVLQRRRSFGSWFLNDTENGANNFMYTNNTNGLGIGTSASSFNPDGFTIGAENNLHNTGDDVVSWTFRKAPGFFDVVTYMGDGTSGQTVNHALDSIPGCIIIKRTDGAGLWFVYHRSADPNKYLRLDSTDAETNNGGPAFSAITSSSFTFDRTYYSDLNQSGLTYVAYIFAHDDQSFGTDGNESIIKCNITPSISSFATTTVNLGWEPQWILAKPVDSSGDWTLADNMRGLYSSISQAAPYLSPNTANSEAIVNDTFAITPTGFVLKNSLGVTSSYIYIAIRRPHKPPTDATEVFSAVTYTGDGTTSRTITAGFPVDLTLNLNTDKTWNSDNYLFTRITNRLLYTNTPAADAAFGTTLSFTSSNANTGVFLGSTLLNGSSKPFVNHFFRRAPGFFEVVAYSGDASSSRQINHNLGVAPELVIIKNKTSSAAWPVWSIYADFNPSEHRHGFLNSTTDFNNYGDFENQVDQSSLFTSSIFTVRASGNETNASAQDYITYLFATLPGISKVGSYSGTGSNINVDCGFTAGARFVLIKRMDASGDWYVWDTARGIISSNDPYFLLNSLAAEVTSTDYIDPLNAGFTVTSSAPAALNASGGTYLFLAIA